MKLSEAFTEKLGQLVELFEKETGIKVTDIDFDSHYTERMEAVDVPTAVSKGFEYKQREWGQWIEAAQEINGIDVNMTAYLKRGIDIGYLCEGEDCHEEVEEDGAMCGECAHKAFQAQAELEAEYRESAL